VNIQDVLTKEGKGISLSIAKHANYGSECLMASQEHLQAVLDALTARLTEALGENLFSCVLHGDEVRGDPEPNPTDLSAFIILIESTSDAHAAITDAVQGRIRSDPLIVTKREIEQSLRTFALRLRSISRKYKVLAGADPFEAFDLDEETSQFLLDHSRRDFRSRSARPAPPLSEKDIRQIDRPLICDNDGWEISSLKAEGIAPSPIAELFARIRRSDYVGIDGLLIARNGLLVAESYFAGFGRSSPHQTRSSFKSATGLLTGIAIADGVLAMDDPVAPLLARYYEPKDLCERKRRITIRNLLQMQAGFDCFEMPGKGPFREDASNKSQDKVAADFDLPMLDEPGATWRYCSGCTFLLGVALESALAQAGSVSLKQYLDDRLLGPLNIANYSMGRTAKGHLSMHGGESMTLRSLAKFGQLILSGGIWNGRQVVPATWISDTLKQGVPTGWSWTNSVGDEPHFQRPSKYRFKWFQTPMRVMGRDYRLIHTWGNGGQFILAVPELDLLVGIYGSNYDETLIEEQKQIFHMLYSFILPAAASG
jgi:CubicO group peptidase (beta-lactamase class C family)